jgi:hypothetical protein
MNTDNVRPDETIEGIDDITVKNTAVIQAPLI